MVNKVYVFNNPVRNNLESAKCLELTAMKHPALVEVIKFVFDGCHGLNPEISEGTIDDAFDCIINYEKATLYAQELPNEEREQMIHQSEVSRKTKKEWFKSILKVK